MIFNIVTLILSLISIIVSVIVFFKTQELTIKYNNLVAGQLALQLRENITSARRRYEDLCLQCFSDNKDVKEHVLNSSIEDLCNTYDQACTLYNLGQLDKEGFQRQYYNEIKNIVESPNFKDKYVQPYTKYQATSKVYNEWFNQEK